MKKTYGAVAKLLAVAAAALMVFSTGSCSSEDDGNGGGSSAKDSGVIKLTAPATAGAVTLVADSNPATTLYTGTSVQEALEVLMNDTYKSSTAAFTISVAKGTYNEMLFYTGAATITIEGTGTAEYGTDVLISYSNSGNSNAMATLASSHGITSGYTRGATRFDGKCNLVLKNVTIQNSYSRSANDGSSTQAEALVFSSTGNLIAYNSSFLSHQDTLYLGQKGGRMWFYKDYISGDVDFIWGYMDVALFEECSIYCRGDEAKKAYIFASRSMTGSEANKGIVLLNNNIEIASGVTAWYGRNSGDDTQAAILNNTITGAGTLNSNLYEKAPQKYVLDVAGDLAIGYKDYNNTFNGTVVDTSNRLTLCGALSERVAKREYNGRYVILNRGYSETDAQYKTASTIWDISKYEEEFGATEDTSSTNIYVDPVYAKNVVGGNTVQLTPSSDVENLTYTYASSDESLATVDANGLVTTIVGAAGTATITVTASNGSTDTMSVKVIPVEIPATAVKVALADTSVAKYGVTTATITFEPADASNQSFTLTSSDSNVKVYDTANQKLASSTTLEASDGTATVQVWVGGDVTNATLTVKSDAYESATAGTATVSTTEGLATWGDACAWRMATDIQNGTAGLWDGLVIDSTAANSELISANGKMSLKTNSSMQTRNVILYIPVEGASTVTITAAKNDLSGCNYYVGQSTDNAFTLSEDKTVATYTYDGGKTGIVLGSTLSGMTFAKTAGGSVSSSGKYLRVDVPKGSADVYIASIKVQKTGEFTATWDDSTSTQTGASGTYSFVQDGTAVPYTSDDGFVVLNSATALRSDHGATVAANETITIHVAGITQIDVLGCAYGNGAAFTAKVGDTTLATVSSCKASTDGGVGATFYYTTDAEADIVITFSGAGWVHGIKVTALDSFTAVSSITVTAADNATSVYVGGTLQLTATTNSDATNQSVTWSSGDKGTATVSSDGVVTGVADGSVTITATANDGSGVTGTYTVSVSTNTAEETGPWTWDWKNGTGDAKNVNIQKTSGTVYAYDTSTSVLSTKVSASVDATNNGKLAYNASGYAQINANTTITIAMTAGQTLAIETYPTNYALTVAGTAYDYSTQNTSISYTATADGDVVIAATGTGYLYSITLSNAE